MDRLIDTSVWIDLVRPRSPQFLKEFITPYVLNPDTRLAGPVTYEVLRSATPQENGRIVRLFQSFPVLATPPDLWASATALGQACRQKGITADPMDLLIAVVTLYHGAMVVTFDDDFRQIAAVSDLRVELLTRPQP